MRRGAAGAAVVLACALLSSLQPRQARAQGAEELDWGLSENQLDGVKFGLGDGTHYAGVLFTCRPPAKDARLEFGLTRERVVAVGSMLVDGKNFFVDVTSGQESLRELPSLSQNEAGFPFGLVITVPIDHGLFGELARTGALQVKGDGQMTQGADAVGASYDATKGKEYARAFVRRCKRSR